MPRVSALLEYSEDLDVVIFKRFWIVRVILLVELEFFWSRWRLDCYIAPGTMDRKVELTQDTTAPILTSVH